MAHSDQRRSSGDSAVGVDLPEVTSLTFGIEVWRPAGADTGDQIAGDKKDGQYRAALPSGSQQNQNSHTPRCNGSRSRQRTGQPGRPGDECGNGCRQWERQLGQLSLASARNAATIRDRTSPGQPCRPALVSSMMRKFSSKRA